MRRLSRHFIALVLLAAAGTLVATDITCVVACFGTDVTRSATADAGSACHARADATDQAGALVTAGAECRDEHLGMSAPIVVGRPIALAAPGLSAPVAFKQISTSTHTPSVVQRSGSPPTGGPALRI